jgi:predicted dehydrogenase
VEVQVSPEFTKAPVQVPAGPPFYTAQLYARLAASLTDGTPLAPDFGAAVRRHRLLEAIQRASDTGTRQTL